MAVRGDGRRHTEDGRQLGPRSDLASDEHVAVADVRPARLAAHDRRVCIEHDAPPLFFTARCAGYATCKSKSLFLTQH